MERSIARVSLFRDRFWRSSKEQKDNVVRSDPFGERMSSEDISWRARYDKVVRYLANEGERNKFRATNRPNVRNWTTYENSRRDPEYGCLKFQRKLNYDSISNRGLASIE